MIVDDVRTPRARTPAKTILLFLGLAFELPEIIARVAKFGLSLDLLLYALLYGILVFCLLCAGFIRQPWLRWGWASAFALATVVVGSFQTATAGAMRYDAFVNVVQSAGSVRDALGQHGVSIAWASAGAALLLLAVGLKPGEKRPVAGLLTILAPIAGLAMLSLMLLLRGGEGARGLPGAWTGLSYSALYAWEMATIPSLPRQPVQIGITHQTTQGDIVLIIDESIAGRYLDINDEAGVRSGLSSPPRGVVVSNFGLAASITNCSYGSNLTLRHGGTREDYQRINATMPSIFSYAKRAGYDTAYIDAQGVAGAHPNGMDDAEKREIDHLIRLDQTPVVERDMAAAAALIKLLNNRRRDFILINKMGAHFPVADKYPESVQMYRPTLPRNRIALVAEMAIPKNLFSDAEAWRRYRNSYRNTVGWTVGGFFDRLFARAKLDGALIVYTSDHGQNLHELGDPGTTTHCNSSPAREEGAVPLVVIDTTGRWTAAAQRSFDASSHYRIFPTLLNAMGYDPKAVRHIYGETLDSPLPDPGTFNSLFNARLGHKPEWVEVRRASVARPPVNDYDNKGFEAASR